MLKQIKRKHIQIIISSISYILIALTMTTYVSYAWFTITNTNQASLVSNISEIEAEYEFFIYQNVARDGSENLTLIDNICEIDGEDLCYKFMPNPTAAVMLDGSTAPGERLSFAIRIRSVNNQLGMLKLDIANLVSTGYILEENKLQSAYYYQVDKVSYINYGIETSDVKDLYGITYNQGYFTYDNDSIYPLVSTVPMSIEENMDTMIVIYFDLYFDPYIYGIDALGFPYTNSNIFLNQTLTIENILMSVST